MDVKKSLQERVARATEREEEKTEGRELKEKEAVAIFEPIYRAMSELSTEVESIDSIKVFLNKNNVRIKLGNTTTLECGWFFFTSEFSVIETNRWGFPSYETSERKHKFETSEQVIDFLVEAAARHIASLSRENKT